MNEEDHDLDAYGDAGGAGRGQFPTGQDLIDYHRTPLTPLSLTNGSIMPINHHRHHHDHQPSSNSVIPNNSMQPPPPLDALLRASTSTFSNGILSRAISRDWSVAAAAKRAASSSAPVPPTLLNAVTSTGQPLLTAPLYSSPILDPPRSTAATEEQTNNNMIGKHAHILAKCAEFQQRGDHLHAQYMKEKEADAAASLVAFPQQATKLSIAAKKKCPGANNSTSGGNNTNSEVAKADSTKKAETKSSALLKTANEVAYNAIRSAKKKTELAWQTDRLFYDVPRSTKICKCKNTGCLKLYCACFQAGTICQAGCYCRECKNTADGGERQKAVASILNRRVDAFEPRQKCSTNGCACKNNRCLRKYCACNAQGKGCTDACKCVRCANPKGRKKSAKMSLLSVKVSAPREPPRSVVTSIQIAFRDDSTTFPTDGGSFSVKQDNGCSAAALLKQEGEDGV